MASRLSEESLRAVLDAGHQSLLIQPDPHLSSLIPIGGESVDLDQLLLGDDPAALVQAVPAQTLYQALLKRGPEDCLELLPLLSEEQVGRIFDYDVWQADQLEPLKAIRWLNLFKEVSNDELHRRFQGLDEEYQLALLGPLIDVFDEDAFEDLSQGEQDVLHRLPCGTLHYRVKSEDPRIVEFVETLVEATLSCDIAYAYSLLTHAAYMPPAEQEAMIGQFRRARLEEDGFVTYTESLAAFAGVDEVALRHKWQFALGVAATTLPVYAPINAEPFLRRVLLQENEGGGVTAKAELGTVKQQLAFLANSLCAAAQVEPDDHQALRRLMEHAQALVSLGLEYLAGGDERAGRAVLKEEHPQILFRVGLALIRRLADQTLLRLAHHKLPDADNLRRLLQLDKRGALASHLEKALSNRLGFEQIETLKGLCNRFPLRPAFLTADEGQGSAAANAAPSDRASGHFDGAPDTTTRPAQRMVFRPIATMAQLTQLAASVDQITGLLYLAALADDDLHVASVPLDQRLLTALSQVLLGGAFRYLALTDGQIKALLEMPQEAARTLAADFFAGVEGTLRVAMLTPEANWAVSQRAGIYVENPIQAVMVEVSDLVLRLAAAREQAKSFAGDDAKATRTDGRQSEVQLDLTLARQSLGSLMTLKPTAMAKETPA